MFVVGAQDRYSLKPIQRKRAPVMASYYIQQGSHAHTRVSAEIIKGGPSLFLWFLSSTHLQFSCLKYIYHASSITSQMSNDSSFYSDIFNAMNPFFIIIILNPPIINLQPRFY